jgi:calcineurin-like phosphoesterase family protein
MRTQKVFFTSDHHFFHQNIIGHCDRPFLDVNEMDEFMIQEWNNTVGPGDLVYHLGDFAITGYSQKHKPKVEKLLRKLNGTKILIAGNHDSHAVLKAEGWANVRKGIHHIKVDGQRFILCHYGMRTWQFKSKGAIHLYGHSHGNLPPFDKSVDVGVDSLGYKPNEFDRIMDIMAKMDIGRPENW